MFCSRQRRHGVALGSYLRLHYRAGRALSVDVFPWKSSAPVLLNPDLADAPG